MLLFYVRHGDPIYNPDSLTDLGKRQAEAVAKRLALYGINRIFSSTSNRAIMTSQPTSEITKKEVTQLDFCNEKHAWKNFTICDEKGITRWVFHDRKYTELFASSEIRQMSDKWYDHPDFARFNFKDGVDRINRETDAWLATLGYEHDRERGIYKAVAPKDERVALFAHQGFGLAFLSSVLDIPYPQIATHFDMGHTGMTVIEFSNNSQTVIPKVLTLANDSHIYRDGLPTYYNNYIRF